MKHTKANTIVLAIMACLLWSTAFVGIKIGLAYTTPLNFAGTRFFISGLLLIPFAGNLIENFRIIRFHLRFITKVALFYTVLLYAFFYIGISLGSASTTAIVVGGGPLFIALLAHFLMPGDRITIKKAVALIIGLSGIVIIAVSRYQFELDNDRAFLAIALLVMANLFGGYGNIMIAKSSHPISPLLLSASQLIIGGAILFIISLIVESPDLFSIKPLPYYGALAYLSIVSSSAITIWFVLLRRPGIKVSELNIWKFLIPVFGALLSWMILRDDSPDKSAVFGMCLIAGSLILINFKGKF